jgi:putative DNA primase/helicase
MTAAEIAARHGLKRIGREWRGMCPACGYKGGLTLSESGGRPLWWCASCRDQEAVGKALLGDAAPARPEADAEPAPREDRRGAVRAMVERARPSPIVPAYLGNRGLRLPPSAPLLYLANAKHPSGRALPCMLALLHDLAGDLVAVHRTFLAPGGTGKAGVEPVRMTLGDVRGAAVRLYPVAPHLVVAEGIETALAAAELLGLPAWAATSAGNLGDSLALPPEVREVTIGADADPPGRRAAKAAAARWRAEGRTVRVAMPDKPGADFNDLLLERKRHG